MLLCPLRCICQMLQPHNVFSGPVSNIFPFSTEPLLRLLLCFCYTNSLYRGPHSRELTPKPMPLSLIVNDHEFCPHARQILHLLTHLCILNILQLLSKPKFSSVEKIKTIGSAYMAATGLNATSGQENPQVYFLHQVLCFCIWNAYSHLCDFMFLLFLSQPLI